jgi:hypothetical protein
MSRTLNFALVAGLMLPGIHLSPRPQTGLRPAATVPTLATVELTITTPGMDQQGSRWEINYEFGIATDALLFEAHKKHAGGLPGELLKQGSIKEPLQPAEHRKVTLRFPLSAETQELLLKQPPVPTEVVMRQMTLEQSREYERHAQNFTFRAIVEIDDARLQKKVFVPLVGAWPYTTFPEAQFKIDVQIDTKGEYVVKYPRPKGATKTEVIRQP